MNALSIFFDKPISYEDGIRLQEQLVAARIADATPDIVLFLEHTPVITMGVRAQEQHILLSREELEQRGIATANTTRGGDVTWHGPGQLIMYPIIRLGERESDARGYLHNLEEVAIRTANDFGICAFRRNKMTGAWTSHGKLAAIGIRLKRWVTFHGLSFNVDIELTGFNAIIPCGLTGEKVTSLRDILKESTPTLSTVRERMEVHFGDVCNRMPQRYTKTDKTSPALTDILNNFILKT